MPTTKSQLTRGQLFMPLLAIALLLGSGSVFSSTLSAQQQAWLLQGDVADIAVGDFVDVSMRNGVNIVGEVVAVTRTEVRVKMKFGVQTLNKDDILEWSRSKSSEEKYAERAAKCSSADDWVELAVWAGDEGIPEKVTEALAKAIEADPEHARARELRGEVKHDGQWMPIDDAMAAQGKVKHRGKWVTPEERDAAIAEEEEQSRNKKLLGLRALEEQYRGRAWGEIAPVLTENYEVWCNSTEDIAEEYAELMEAFYERYQKIFPTKHFPRRNFIGQRSKVYIHKSHEQFMDWTGQTPGVGGFYRPWLHDVTAYHGSFGVTGSTEEVLAHEGTHQFQGIIFKGLSNCPMWIVEGMAVYFGDGTEINGSKVEINVIPRDRLVGLKRAIKDGTYCDLRQLLRSGRGRFTGFHYGHAWGVIFWCLNAGKGKYSGKYGKNGVAIIEDYLLRAKDLEKFLDPNGYEAEAQYFEKLITDNCGVSIETWETAYKEWILELPLPELGQKKGGNKWVSEKLLVEVQKPSGWVWVVPEDLNTLAQEAVAMTKGTKRAQQRISTHVMPNWTKAELSVVSAQKFLEGLFSGIKFEQELEMTRVEAYDAVVGTFKATRRVRRESTLNADDEGGAANEELAERSYKVVIYGDPDKMRANMLESDHDQFEANLKTFDWYLQRFKITY